MLDKAILFVYTNGCVHKLADAANALAEYYKKERTNDLYNIGVKKMKNSSLLFGEYVRRRREKLGKTLRKFATEVNISPAYLSDIENGNRRAPEKFLSQFAKALGIQTAEELHHFYDLAGVSMNGQHTDINVYMDQVPTARVALREAKDANLTDEDWQKLIVLIKNKNR